MQNAYSINNMDKNELRRIIKEKKKNISIVYRQQASTVINDKVIALDEYENADTIFSFIGVEAEPDTRNIIATALEKGKRVCVPLCVDDGIMEAKEISDFDDLRRGAFGLLEPKDGLLTIKPEEIDLAIVPCVTCNYQGERLGHGKGYYDRYLEGQSFYTVMVCFDKLISDEIPTDVHDKKMDKVITEK